MIMEAIPDIPEEIDIQLERTDFITSRLIDKLGAEDSKSDDMKISLESLEINQYPDYGDVYKHEVHESVPDSAQLYRWRPI